MKQIQNTFVRIVLFSVCGVFFLSDFAQGYQDDFDVLKEKNWEHWGQYALWKAENGFLKGWIQVPDFFADESTAIELLQFKDSSGSYDNFDIINGGELIQRQVKKPGYENFTVTFKKLRGKACRFRHRGQTPLPRSTWSGPPYYLFLTHRMYAVSFSAWGKFVAFMPARLQKHNLDIRWKTRELASMEIRFNRGHFQWYADGEKRADFEDPEFPSIEILGFVVIGSGLRVGHVWVDSFKISGPGLSVSPQAKLATTWGKLKQRQ